ncbi:MAG: HNH endonuclease [Gemmatimonadaceae bacterium]|nr:HNH endonuclease [Gemmatimonadaceae bacterium]
MCVPGYSKKVRNVPAAVKRKVYAAYGITHHAPGEYEVDHLISLELGGSNAIANLWPESYRTTPWNARVKDALENYLHREVCAGRISLKDAQREIATDWIASYQRHFHRKLPK